MEGGIDAAASVARRLKLPGAANGPGSFDRANARRPVTHPVFDVPTAATGIRVAANGPGPFYRTNARSSATRPALDVPTAATGIRVATNGLG
ncbi:hypothetical protein BGC_28320 [Burkholderia sp. 3C]